MKQRTFALILFLLPFISIKGQVIFTEMDGPKVISSVTGDTLQNPFAGGFYNPQFSNIDLDGDGKKDLFIFDRMDEKILTFLWKDGKWVHDPYYERFFPGMTRSSILADYNNDGKPDIFTYSEEWGAGFEVWKNITKGNFPAFSLASELLYADYGDFKSNIYLSYIDIPTITDVDNDGDLDILTFSIMGGYIDYYENISTDSNFTLDSLKFRRTDGCWGSFLETDSTTPSGTYIPTYIKFINPNNPGYAWICNRAYKSKKKKHAGATVLALDIDGDGDKDLLMGEIDAPGLMFVENGKKDYSHSIDTIISFKTNFPSSKSVNIVNFPAAYYSDATGDGINDLIVSPQQENNSATLNQVWLYENTGTLTKPVFSFKENNFLQNTMIDHGSTTAPAFFDYDADGDQDMLVATSGNYVNTRDSADYLVLYQNIGNSKRPVFKMVNSNYLNLKPQKFRKLIPAFADHDNDGDVDLFFGNERGEIIYYENIAGAGNTASFQLKTTSWQNIKVGVNSAPAFADINGDGLIDLVIGEFKGNINYYRNTGTKTNPSFILETDSMAGVKLFMTTPAIADFDNDSTLDMVVGTGGGKLYFYPSVAKDPKARIRKRDSIIFDTLSRSIYRKSFGSIIHPAAAFLNKDSLPDLVLGNIRGGLIYLGSMKMDSVITSDKSHVLAKALKWEVFPNPASGQVQINFELDRANGQNFISIASIHGKEIKRISTGQLGTVQIPTSTFPAGMYIVRLLNSRGMVLSKTKLIVTGR